MFESDEMYFLLIYLTNDNAVLSPYMRSQLNLGPLCKLIGQLVWENTGLVTTQLFTVEICTLNRLVFAWINFCDFPLSLPFFLHFV